MKTFNDKLCKRCNKEFTPQSPGNLFCSDECYTLTRKEKGRLRNALNRQRAGGKVGVGKGGNPYYGEAHPNWKNGISRYIAHRTYLKNTVGHCMRCNKDLSTATRYEWACHHKDHDRNNNQLSNLELLCKRCHQIEHECFKAFEGATTIPQGSRIKRSEAPDPSTEGDDIV